MNLLPILTDIISSVDYSNVLAKSEKKYERDEYNKENITVFIIPLLYVISTFISM